MIRIAAAGDLHYDRGSGGKLLPHFERLKGSADFLLLAGDLTHTGHVEEARLLASDLAKCPVPVFAVLGNHDYHLDQPDEVSKHLEGVGVTVLEQSAVSLEFNRCTVGIAGVKGFGGGYVGACASDFGEPEMKSFIRHTQRISGRLTECLSGLETDYRVVLMHYSPTTTTLLGERKEIYPFLGSYLLAEAVDHAGADIVFHGHAHRGTEKGETPGGTPVRNVAQPVIRHAFNIYTIEKSERRAHLAARMQELDPSNVRG